VICSLAGLIAISVTSFSALASSGKITRTNIMDSNDSKNHRRIMQTPLPLDQHAEKISLLHSIIPALKTKTNHIQKINLVSY
jgi:hypothetical protein